MSTKYGVSVEKFAERYYLKNFRRRYKKAFDIPWNAHFLMLQKFDLMLEKERTHRISDPNKEIVICKCDFKILPNESAKESGNRCIVAQYVERKEIKILLVYCKNDIQGHSETVWWKNIIKENYPIYKEFL